jgi:hypothetical protein
VRAPATAAVEPASGVTPAGAAPPPNGAGAPANAPLKTVEVPPCVSAADGAA